MKVAIVAAMQEELAPFRQHFGAKQLVFEQAKTRIESVNPPEGTEISPPYWFKVNLLYLCFNTKRPVLQQVV